MKTIWKAKRTVAILCGLVGFVAAADGQVKVLVPTQTGINSLSATTLTYPATFLVTVAVTRLEKLFSPTGTVIIEDSGSTLATGTLSGGTVNFFLGPLAAGTHSITAHYQGDNVDAPSTSAALVLTVSQAAVTTTVTASPSPSNFGQPVTITATVSSPTVSSVSGTVLFVDGVNNTNTVLGSVPVSGGRASFSTSTLSIGAHVVNALFNGGSDYSNSSQGLIFQTVNGVKAGTQTSIMSSLNPSIVGQPVTFSVSVSSSGPGAATGTVAFKDGGTTLATVSLSNASASYTESPSTGTHSITAVYSGDTNFTGSTSPTLSEIINSSTAATTTSLVSSANPSTPGQSVTFTATVNPSGPGTPTGIVTFWDGNNELGSFALNGKSASLSTSSFSTGSHSITAGYGGDITFSSSTSPVLTQTVSAAVTATTSTTVASSLNPSIVGQPVTFTASVSSSGSGTPNGTVAFKDGGTTLATVSLNNATASYTGSPSAGTHPITAVYSGDANYTGSTSAILSEVVNSSTAATTTSLVSSANPSAPGQSVTFTATVNPTGPGSPTGIVTFWDGATELGSFALNGKSASLSTSSLSLGSHSITAGYGGDIAFSPSTSLVVTQTVSAAATATSTTVASSVNPSNFGQSVMFTALVTASGSGTPTGTVTFKDGTTTLGSAALNGARATFTVSTLAAGSHPITAVYGGDADFSGSTSSALSQTVNAVSGATSVSIASSANPSTAGQSVTFTAAVGGSSAGTPTGTVAFKDGAVALASTSLNGGSASVTTSTLSVGSHSITAVYSGDGNFTGSTSATLTQTVQSGTATGSTSALAHFAAGSTWTTGIFVVNTGSQAAQFSITFYNDDGTPAILPFSTGATGTLAGAIPGNGSAYFAAANPQGNLVSGWANITADSSLVVQALFRSDVAGTFYEAAVPSSSGAKEFLIPFDATTFSPTGAPFYTGFAVANLDSSTAAVTCTARDSGGAAIPNGVTVPALSPMGHWANYLFPALTGKRGTIDCSSNTNVSAVALRFIGGNAFSSLPIVSDPSSYSGGAHRTLAHFAAGDVWTTGFFVLNTGTSAAQFSIAFHDDGGNPVALPFTGGPSSTLIGALTGQGSAYFEAGNAQAPLMSGSAQITADPTIVVQALFRDNSTGLYYEAAVPSSSGSREFLLPFDATTFSGNGQAFYTGFAIANLDQTPADVTCTARDSNGVAIPNAVIVPSLAPLGHWANYFFPVLTGTRGIIDCVSNTNVAATALRFIGSNAFSSLPVITK